MQCTGKKESLASRSLSFVSELVHSVVYRRTKKALRRDHLVFIVFVLGKERVPTGNLIWFVISCWDAC